MAYIKTNWVDNVTMMDDDALNKIENGLGDLDTQLADNAPLLGQTLSTEEVDIFIVYGQSNAKGYAANTVGDPLFKTPNVTVWNGTTEIPLTNYMPSQNDGISTGGAWVAFANEYARKTGRKAILANCGTGSQSIADLSKNAVNTNYSGTVTWTNNIKTYITLTLGKTVGKVTVLWCQGERDSVLKTPKLTYKLALETLWTNLKIDTGATLFSIFTIGFYDASEDKLHAFVIQSIQRRFSKTNLDVIIAFDDIESLGANSMKNGSVHLNQIGYNYMGENGAKTVVYTLFTDNSYAQDATINRQGVINLDGSQEWKHYGGWLNGGLYQPTVLTSRACSNIVSVAIVSDHLEITLADKIDYILSVGASVTMYNNGAALSANAGINAVFDKTIYNTIDADGKSVVKLYFVGDISARVRMFEQTIDTLALGIDLGSMFSVVWGVGSAVVTHPTSPKLSTASVRDITAPFFMSCRSFPTTTTLNTWNLAGVATNSELGLDLKSLKIPPALLTSMEVSFFVIGAEKSGS